MVEHAPAKINLTLDIVGRRPDGYHELVSLVAFAGVGDRLTLTPGGALGLTARGPFGAGLGDGDDNLVLVAARALAAEMAGLVVGRFVLDKRLPVASGIGGGSADAAAALRLLARANRLALDDPRLAAAARAVGADVPVCLDPRSRLMRGIGDILSVPLDLPKVPAVLVNPGVPVATKAVFSALAHARAAGDVPAMGPDPTPAIAIAIALAATRSGLIDVLTDGQNDLEPAAIAIEPIIADVLDLLHGIDACRLARMSGSGATCFGLFDSARAAAAAAGRIRAARPSWWVRATAIG